MGARSLPPANHGTPTVARQLSLRTCRPDAPRPRARDTPGIARRPGTHVSLPAAAAIGVAVGLLSGLFGVGGGVLIVPGLVALGMPQRLAHGTSLAAIAPVACAGVAGYALGGSVDWAAAGIIVVGAAGGAILGTRALRRIPERRLALAFTLFLVASAATLPFQAAAPALRVALDAASIALLVAIGLGAGALSGLLGVGGGILTIPALTLLLGIAPAVSRGTSLAVIIPTAIVGSIQNVRAGNADLRAAAAVGLPGTASSLVASLLSVRLDPLLSTILFAALCLAVAARMFLATRRRESGGPRSPNPRSRRSGPRATPGQRAQPPRPNRLPRRASG